MNKLETLTKIIKKAVPDIECRNTSMKLDGVFSGLINFRDDRIWFDDVLIVIRKNIEQNGEPQDKLIYSMWQLGESLENQQPEMWDYLLEILR